jgi:hypothetical protein
MAKCDTCGNDYDKSFEVKYRGTSYTFDCFECAIHKLAPRCAHCSCTVMGHGVEAQGKIFCCGHCSQKYGVKGVVDRV